MRCSRFRSAGGRSTGGVCGERRLPRSATVTSLRASRCGCAGRCGRGGSGGGLPEGILIFAEDITARVNAENRLKAREAQLRTAFEAMSDAVLITDAAGRLQMSNEAFGRFHGLAAGDAGPGAVAEWPVERALRGERGKAEEFVAESRETGERWVGSCNYAPIRDESGVITGAVLVARDVTQQRREREEREALHRQYMDLVDNSPDGIARLDPEGRYLFMNRRGLEMGRARLEDFVGKRIGEVRTENPEYWIGLIREVVKTRQMVVVEVGTGPRVANLRVRLAPEMGADGSVQSVLLIATDLGALHAAEQEAKDRQALIAAVFEASSQALLAVDGEGRIQLANRVVTEMFGYPMEELLGAPLAMLLPGYEGAAEEIAGRNRDGTGFPVTCRMNRFGSARGEMSVAVVSDVTRQKQQEQQLREAAESIRALGLSLLTAEEDTARAVARELHDDITQRLALLAMEIGHQAKDSASGRLAGVLEGYQERLIEISMGLRRISHQMHPAILEQFGLSAAIESLCEEFEGQMKVTVRFAAEGVPEQLDRNLALCLYRVCQECLRNVEKHAEAERVEVVLTGGEGWLRLLVEDNGKGFAGGRPRQGLGLYSMQERLQLVGGALTMGSTEGEGAWVEAAIPLREESGRGAARILLADDHALLLEGTKALLAQEYDVVGTATDGRQLVEEALRLRPDVVVSDISMPGMNGIEAVRRILAERPETKVVFLTMHSSSVYLRRVMAAGAGAYVLKVAAGEDLREAVRAVMSGRSFVSRAVREGGVREGG